MPQIENIHPNTLAIIGLLLTLTPLVIGITRWLWLRKVRQLEEENQRLKQNLEGENQRLRQELDTRLQTPGYVLDMIKLTELRAEQTITNLEEQHRKALESKDQQLARTLQAESQRFQQQLETSSTRYNQLITNLQHTIPAPHIYTDKHAIGLPTGLILLVKHQGKYGAVQAIEQTSSQNGGFIRYSWWYQPDGTESFTNPNVQRGFNIAYAEPPEPELEWRIVIGPIKLLWSTCNDSHGWVYFGPLLPPSPTCLEYELLVTKEINIRKINIAGLSQNFIRVVMDQHIENKQG
jgi:hypothetical protein